MTDVYVASILKNINDITVGIDNNALITKTRTAVLTGIKSFQTTPAKKAELYANFEMQFSVQVVTKLIDAVIGAGLIEQQIEVEKLKVQLLTQQILSEVQNTAKGAAEIALLQSNKGLVEAQILTQAKQRLDVMAGINIKNEQALSTRQSTKFEEARRHVLIESTQQNSQIQKSKEENAMFNSMAIDESFVITESHLTRIKAALDGITTTAVSYAEELDTTTNPVGQIDAGI
jgi:hypothetical protein